MWCKCLTAAAVLVLFAWTTHAEDARDYRDRPWQRWDSRDRHDWGSYGWDRSRGGAHDRRGHYDRSRWGSHDRRGPYDRSRSRGYWDYRGGRSGAAATDRMDDRGRSSDLERRLDRLQRELDDLRRDLRRR